MNGSIEIHVVTCTSAAQRSPAQRMCERTLKLETGTTSYRPYIATIGLGLSRRFRSATGVPERPTDKQNIGLTKSGTVHYSASAAKTH